MSPFLRIVSPVAALLAVAACARETTDAAAEPVLLGPVMEEVITVETETILNILIDALDEETKVDPDRISEEDWARMRTSAGRLRDEMIAVRNGPVVAVGEPDDVDGSSGVPPAAEIQARIDADPDGFRAHSQSLIDQYDTMAVALERRDTETMWRTALSYANLCTACHEAYWYPDWYVPPGQ